MSKTARYVFLILFIYTYLTPYASASPSPQPADASGTAGELRVGRYTFIEPGADTDQLDILSVVVSDTFPKRVDTVGEALEVILANSGYRLAPDYAACPSMAEVKSWPLPRVHRDFGPIQLIDALTMLVGTETHTLVVDPVHRLVSFEATPRYREIAYPEAMQAPTLPNQRRFGTTAQPQSLITRGTTGYGPIQRDDELFHIAEQLPRPSGVTHEQMMVALYAANPRAFCHDNMNCLNKGLYLRYPATRTLVAVDTAEAKEIVKAHWRRWKRYQKAAATRNRGET